MKIIFICLVALCTSSALRFKVRKNRVKYRVMSQGDCESRTFSG